MPGANTGSSAQEVPDAAGATAPLLRILALNQYYGGSHTLRNVNLELREGRIRCLLGRNGVGKSTLLKVLMGLVAARSGRIQLGEATLNKLPAHLRVQRGLGYVPQGREIFNRLSVEENLLCGLAGLPARKGSRIPAWIYEWFPVLEKMRSRKGGDLSGGQQQQLAIARAVLARPKVLLLDEPTEGIQPSIIKDIGRVIRRLAHEEGVCILLVEQYYDFAASLADDYAVMSRGQIIEQGPASQMAHKNLRALLTV
jgi:urea transport system ATP-binding protein